MYKIHYGKIKETEKKEGDEDILISPEIPTIYHKLHDKFGVEWEGDENIIICNGDTIHCKAAPIPPEKLVHEIEHVKRQKIYGKDLWWDRYISDDSFRLGEELLAYRAEYAFIFKNIKDRELRFQLLWEMARSLSGKTYGSIIEFSEAQKLIQQK